MKKFLIIVTIIIILAFIANNLEDIRVAFMPEKGPFDDVFLSKFTDSNFNRLSVVNNKYISSTKEKHIIEEALNLFRNLEVKEIKQVNSVPNSEDKYEFYLSNIFERLWIEIFDKNHIWVCTDVLNVKVKGNITYKTTVSKYAYYKIEKSTINFETIKKIFNQLEPNE